MAFGDVPIAVSQCECVRDRSIMKEESGYRVERFLGTCPREEKVVQLFPFALSTVVQQVQQWQRDDSLPQILAWAFPKLCRSDIILGVIE